MEKTKRSRTSSLHNSNNIKRRKIKGKSSFGILALSYRYFLVKTVETDEFDDRIYLNLSKESVTHFEDLSNEIIYEIFEYLDYLHVYQSFFDLNIRFRKIFTNSNFPIKINISSISKSIFQRYYTHIIIPYQHRIISLSIVNFLSFDLDISPHRILSTFTRLKTLILVKINSEYLENILEDIASLPNLSSLTIIPIDYVKNANDLLLQIFRLSVLKYCKISFKNEHTNFDLLPFATNEYSSPTEQFVIKHQIDVNNLDRLLSYVPQLRRLSLDRLGGYYKNRLNHPIALNYLTHLFLKLIHFTFNDFELLIKNLFCTIQVLHLYIEDGEEYLNAERWKQLILSYIPNLRIFDIQCIYSFVINKNAQLRFDFLFDQFTLPFWFERQWFFARRDYFKYGYHNSIFYSTNPYRRKDYKLVRKLNQYTRLENQETNLSSVRHVHISDDEAIINCINHFLNVTDLTLKNISARRSDSFIINLKHIISLKNLTKLIIEDDDYSFERLIELLSLTPNIHILKIQSIILNRKDLLTIQNSENFRLVMNGNTIRSLTVKQICEIEKIELLFILCSRLQHFTIEEPWTRVDELVRLLLSKNNNNTRHLFSLSISNENKRLPNKLNTLIQAGKLLDNYFIKSDYPKIYLWW
ncbi:unnamed protein product [Rotaria sp. Silwood1]|nr:unnamed protein product [Rotaria sp. Silwood1]CAF1679778.1 unnamed protein product [Rotaria sp. Silwood1]